VTLFEPYEPEANRREPADVEVARAEPRDVEALARLVVQRGGLPVEDVRPRFAREVELDDPGHGLWVARLGGEAVAFARLAYQERPADCVPNHQPAGWYMTGVIVDEAHRRRGIARRLTRARIDFLLPRAAEVYYVANARNRSSIDLHADFGFEELTRDFHAPRVSFTGGEGILFRLDLRRRARETAGEREA